MTIAHPRRTLRAYLAVFLASMAVGAAVHTVDSTGDGAGCVPGNCTLRGALTIAGANDTIRFLIPGCAGVCRIAPATALPRLDVGGLVLDGSTQPGSTPDAPGVLLDGSGAPAGTVGLHVRSAANRIERLIVQNFKAAGILLEPGATPGGRDTPPAPAGGNRVRDCLVGTDAAGQVAAPNRIGIQVLSSDNVIGPNNLISGNTGEGVQVFRASSNQIVEGNRIGTNRQGTAPLPNETGVQLQRAKNSRVEGNCLSGNTKFGLWIQGRFENDMNQVVDNRIGPACDGSPLMPNSNRSDGVHVDASHQNQLLRNIVSGNGANGITIEDSNQNVVEANQIGVSSSGPLPNAGYGIDVQRGDRKSLSNRLGPGNLIAKNGRSGIHVEIDSTSNRITQNSMYENGGRGIALAPIGEPPTVPLPAGVVPTAAGNRRLRPPAQLTVVNLPGGLRVVQGRTCAGCTVELFLATPDMTGAGQGSLFLGSVQPNAGGVFSSLPYSASTIAGRQVTTTATDPNDDTSEFSQNLLVP